MGEAAEYFHSDDTKCTVNAKQRREKQIVAAGLSLFSMEFGVSGKNKP